MVLANPKLDASSLQRQPSLHLPLRKGTQVYSAKNASCAKDVSSHTHHHGLLHNCRNTEHLPAQTGPSSSCYKLLSSHLNNSSQLLSSALQISLRSFQLLSSALHILLRPILPALIFYPADLTCLTRSWNSPRTGSKPLMALITSFRLPCTAFSKCWYVCTSVSNTCVYIYVCHCI